jgi:hypothetical protein
MSGASDRRNLARTLPFTAVPQRVCAPVAHWNSRRKPMNGVIYLVGLIVVVLFILSLFGLR